MAKSVRVNLSIPHATYARYAEWARLTGSGVPALVLQQVVHQSAFVQRLIKTMNYEPRGDIRSVEQAFEDSSEVPVVRSASSRAVVRLSRQQKRAQKRAERKGGK